MACSKITGVLNVSEMLVQSHGHSRRNVSELHNSSQSPKVLQMSKSLSTFTPHGIEAANISWGQVTATFNLKTNWHAMWYKPKLLWGRIPQATTTTTSLGKLQRNTNTGSLRDVFLIAFWMKKKIFFLIRSFWEVQAQEKQFLNTLGSPFAP